MSLFIGADLGTGSLKLLLSDSRGKILKSVFETYPVLYPLDGYTEQNPADWIAALDSGMARLLSNQSAKDVRAIAVGGQMHGLVPLDRGDKVIRNCILWNDGRTARETEFLNSRKSEVISFTSNMAFAGFTAPKLLWLKANEPKNFERTATILLPKDYINFYLTGEKFTDCSDASGTLLFDVKNRKWSEDMRELIDIPRSALPPVFESFKPVGKLRGELEKKWGLKDVIVAAGAGDNAAAAIGTGTVGDGAANISLGTSGTLFLSQSKFHGSQNPAVHSFCHADGGYHLLGCILSAASCNSWWMGVLKAEDFAAEQTCPLPAGDVYFMPYLSGERSPHNDPHARGAFLGLSHTTTREQMTAAVMEGVAFALRDCLEAVKSDGVKISEAGLCGGGAKSVMWQKILASALNLKLKIPCAEEGPAFGAAILAMTAVGEYPDIRSASKAIVKTEKVICPRPELVEKYDKKYLKFRELYPALKNFYGRGEI